MRDVIARIERVPSAPEVHVEPCGKIHNSVWRWHPDVAQVAGALPRRYIHAPAERNGQMGVIATDASIVFVNIPPRRLGLGDRPVAIGEAGSSLRLRLTGSD